MDDHTRNTLTSRLAEVRSDIVERTSAAVFTHNAPASAWSSRDNLLAYLALRRHDLHELQAELADHGLSSLGRLEDSVVHSIDRVLDRLHAPHEAPPFETIARGEAADLLAERSRALLGRPREGRNTRIMVTVDSTVSTPNDFVALLDAGMDLVRINCAHEGPAEWRAIVDALRRAESMLGVNGDGPERRCRVLMDLCGPRLRTAAVGSQAREVKLGPPDGPGLALLVRTDVRVPPSRKERVLRVTGDVSSLRPGDELSFSAPGGEATVRVLAAGEEAVLIAVRTPIVVMPGMRLTGPKGTELIAAGAPGEATNKIATGSTLWLHAAEVPPEDAPAPSIGCSEPPAIAFVRVGDRVFMDDGKVEAIVRCANPGVLELEVVRPEGGVKLKPGKGLNFPDTRIQLPALMPHDLETLDTVVQIADCVGLSFVHEPEDIRTLIAELRARNAGHIGIVAKIETREAVRNLARILIAGFEHPGFGIMIARGDLAVEAGFEHLALLQEDILCLCEAAHTPVIWATQVLETLAHRGLPARAEITDAAAAQRADCVMLNKGPHVVRAVETLRYLLVAGERHHEKKRDIFRDFTEQRGVFPPAAEHAVEAGERSPA